MGTAKGGLMSSSASRRNSAVAMSESDFFALLLRKLDQTEIADVKDRWLLYLGLRAMHTEARVARIERDHLLLKGTWKMLWPNLKRYGLLDELSQDLELKEKIQNFIGNEFQFEQAAQFRPFTARRTSYPSNYRKQKRAQKTTPNSEAVELAIPFAADEDAAVSPQHSLFGNRERNSG
jgi:hypothetical protein